MIETATIPRNTYGGDPDMIGRGFRGGSGALRVQVPAGCTYRPPEGWSIDSIRQCPGGTVNVRLKQEGDE
jgi:hypothetical protein